MPAADLATLRSNRVTKSSTEGFDQITAVTQGAINFQLKKMWENEEKLQTFNITRDDDGGNINAVMDAPKVQFLLGPDNHAVMFYLNLASGTFEWWKGKGRNAVLVPQEFSKWRLAFRVNLNLQEIKNKDSIPNEIKTRLEHYGDYSVQALLLDFTTANVAAYDDDLSSLPGLRGDKDPVTDYASKRSDFVDYMNEFMTIMSESQGSHNILGYIPKFPNPSGTAAHAPTIPPTSLTFQNYPYLPDPNNLNGFVTDLYSGDAARVALANNNMLIFLEMTNNRPLPLVALNTTANWVIPGDGGKLTDGTIALSRRIFLDGYLLPNLISLNRAFEVVAKETYCRADGVKYNVLFDARWGGANSGQPDSYYAWKPKTETTVDESATAILKPAFSNFESATKGPCFIWNWSSATSKEDPGTIGWYESKLNCSSNNWLIIPKGSPNGKCSIYICGTTSVYGMFHASWIDGGDTTVTGKWSAEILFDTAISGGIQVTFNSNKLDMKTSRSELLFEGPLGTIESKFQQMISGLPLDSTIATLRELLNGKWQFFFPGAGDFFFKDPLFNYNGDLLLDLQYKGY